MEKEESHSFPRGHPQGLHQHRKPPRLVSSVYLPWLLSWLCPCLSCLGSLLPIQQHVPAAEAPRMQKGDTRMMQPAPVPEYGAAGHPGGHVAATEANIGVHTALPQASQCGNNRHH